MCVRACARSLCEIMTHYGNLFALTVYAVQTGRARANTHTHINVCYIGCVWMGDRVSGGFGVGWCLMRAAHGWASGPINILCTTTLHSHTAAENRIYFNQRRPCNNHILRAIRADDWLRNGRWVMLARTQWSSRSHVLWCISAGEPLLQSPCCRSKPNTKELYWSGILK